MRTWDALGTVLSVQMLLHLSHQVFGKELALRELSEVQAVVARNVLWFSQPRRHP